MIRRRLKFLGHDRHLIYIKGFIALWPDSAFKPVATHASGGPVPPIALLATNERATGFWAPPHRMVIARLRRREALSALNLQERRSCRRNRVAKTRLCV